MHHTSLDAPMSPSRTHSIVGTLEYMAPEVMILFGKRKVHKDGYTAAVDFWCLGILIYKLLTNIEPFTNTYNYESLQAILPNHLSKYNNYRDAYYDLFGKVEYDIHDKMLNEATRSILHGLLEFNAENRLGYNADDIKAGHVALMNHAFFSGIDWTLLECKQVPPPYIPTEVMDVINQESSNIKSLTAVLCDANKEHWCEEFNLETISTYPEIGKKQLDKKMQIKKEDQYYFRKWNYINPNLCSKASSNK